MSSAPIQPAKSRWTWSWAVLVALPATVLAPANQPTPDAQRIAAGQRIFRWQCSSCHALDENRTGPRLRGVVGRTAGSITDFRYSPALARAGFAWDDVSLNRWLSGPARFIPGVRMDAQVQDRADRMAVIAFLQATATDRH